MLGIPAKSKFSGWLVQAKDRYEWTLKHTRNARNPSLSASRLSKAIAHRAVLCPEEIEEEEESDEFMRR